jgi:periplasmic glucans biosynthesis protein
MIRRDALKLGAAFSAVIILAQRTLSSESVLGAEVLAKIPVGESTPFSEDAVAEEARVLSRTPYTSPMDTIPPAYKALSYDQYRAIRFRKDLALWKDDKLRFTVEFFSAGYIYQTPVQIFVVDDGRATELNYNPDLFSYGPETSRPPERTKPGFSGFRIHAPIDKPGVMDEFAVFQGASYFRSKAAGQDYGMSARGLAIDTGQPPADEFPIFRSFWLIKPAPGVPTITVYALLDSASVSGAYRFVISPAQNTVMDVACTLFPRKTMTHSGIAPLTSMFWFAPSSGYRADEVRQRVHDSDGLSIWNGKGEHIWRPLINPGRIQFSSFADSELRGFGLLQRERRPDRYQDFDAGYERRPSVWVEPAEPWGEGSVDLVEIPTDTEYSDNIVAFWHPKEPLNAGGMHKYRYKLSWSSQPPIPQHCATVAQTLVGASTQHPGMRLFYIDFKGTEDFHFCNEFDDFCPSKTENLELTASTGTIVNVAIRRNKISGGHRIGFEYQPSQGLIAADLRCTLMKDGKAISEVWIYRWTS